MNEPEVSTRFRTRRGIDELPDLLALLVFCSVTALLFRSWEFALIVTASLGFHELGHAAALAWHRLDYRISFGLVGAWTWSPADQRANLSHLSNTLIHLAGPFFSLLLALLAMGLQVLWQPQDDHLPLLANFSAQVCLLNLLPFGNLTDGGKIARRMIDSLDPSCRWRVALLQVGITLLLLGLYVFLELPHLQGGNPAHFLLSLLLVGCWMVSSMLLEANRAPRTSPDSSKQMTPGQVYFMSFIMWDLLALGLSISAATPFWLAPEFVMGSLRNIAAVIWFFRSALF